MPYIERDSDGKVASISLTQTEKATEMIDADSLELRSFLTKAGLPEPTPERELLKSDHEIARVAEDLIHLLIAKGTILFTELPAAVQQKLLDRERLRAQISDTEHTQLLNDDESI